MSQLVPTAGYYEFQEFNEQYNQYNNMCSMYPNAELSPDMWEFNQDEKNLMVSIFIDLRFFFFSHYSVRWPSDVRTKSDLHLVYAVVCFSILLSNLYNLVRDEDFLSFIRFNRRYLGFFFLINWQKSKNQGCQPKGLQAR